MPVIMPKNGTIERCQFGAADIHAATRQGSTNLSPVNLTEIRFGIDSMTDAKHKPRAMPTLRRIRH